MTVTFDPNRDQTDPSSSPMTPAPMMIISGGTASRDKAPVEEMIFFSSISIPGKGVTSDPVAMRMFLVLIVETDPSSAVTWTSLGDLI